MLPQPNFGPSKGPSKGPAANDDADLEGPPGKLRWLRITLWIQTIFAVLAGNMLIIQLLTVRQTPEGELADDLAEQYERAVEAADGTQEDIRNAIEQAGQDAAFFHGSAYLTSTLVIAGLMIIAAIVSALCAVRLKSRLKSVRRLAIGASIVLLLLAMLAVVTFGQQLFLALMLWVFAAILSVWWLFSRDIKDWLSESAK